jgi:hypothetical protein
VALDLIDRGHETGLLNQSFQGLEGEVRHADGSDLAFWQLVHGFPCLAVGDRVVNVDLIRLGRGREQVRVRVLTGPKVDGPVNKIKVKPVKLKLGERVIKRSFDIGGIMLGVPEFGSNENVLPLQPGDVLVRALDALSNFFLVFIAAIGGETRQLPFSVKRSMLNASLSRRHSTIVLLFATAMEDL